VWAPTLKTIKDGVEMRPRILLAFEEAEREPALEERKSLLTFVIVGGGSTGVELAGALADFSGRVMSQDSRSIRPRDAQIVLVEAGGRILSEFPDSLSIRAEQSLTRRGVEVLKFSPVSAGLPEA
jgi:NADH dehydrogenase